MRVYQLSARNWELAKGIMTNIEKGNLNKNKRKKESKVYQPSFDIIEEENVKMT